MKKFILNEHTYQGLAGETTDFMSEFDDFTKANEHYEDTKSKYCDYQDSFVQLFVYENGDFRLLKAYYNENYAGQNEYEKDRFVNGEYVNEKLIEAVSNT